MRAVVIDTNVGTVANGDTEQASPACVVACIDRLERVRSSELVVIDDGFRILDEYRRHMSLSGQPGAGDFFFKWLWTNQANPDHCEQVRITPVAAGAEEDYEEFPRDPALAGFDPSDRKFVAAALASRNRPEILNASDTDWHIFREPLARNGVRIAFLCPELMRHRG